MAGISPLVVLPPAIVAGLAATFYWGMGRQNPDELPSTFIGHPAPELGGAPLAGFDFATYADLRSGEVTLVNFWATWCPPCRAEHPKLKDMAANGIRIVGVNIRDDNAKATAYLTEEGDPFIGVVSDPTGRRSIDWGVTAPPETFIVNGDGTVLFKFIGPLIGSDYEQRFLPELQKALGQGS